MNGAEIWNDSIIVSINIIAAIQIKYNIETKLRTRHDIFYYKITSHLIEKGSRLRPALTHRGANFSHFNFQLNFNFDQPSPSPCTSPLPNIGFKNRTASSLN